MRRQTSVAGPSAQPAAAASSRHPSRGRTRSLSNAPPSAHHQLRIAVTLSRANDLSQLRRRFEAWAGLVSERRVALHLKRCAVALKHGHNRQHYTRFFLRWLAATQRSAAQEAKRSYTPPKEVLLRTRKDVLTLVRRYFGQWRRHLRERRQRTVTNVELLARVNEERARRQAFAVWRDVHRQRRDAVYEERFAEAEATMDGLTAQLRAREVELGLLSTAVREATAALGGSPPKPPVHDATGASAAGSLAHSRELAEALGAAVRQAQRGAADAEDAHAELTGLRGLVSALAEMMETAEGAPAAPSLKTVDSRTPSSSPLTPAGSSLIGRANGGAGGSHDRVALRRTAATPASALGKPAALSPRSGGRRTVANSPPTGSLTEAGSHAEAAARGLASTPSGAAPQRLLDQTVRLMQAAGEARTSLDARAVEVRELQDVMLRAIDAFGGRGGGERFAGLPSETLEQSRRRSTAVADGLGQLCEDMVVVLVLTSLWSQDGSGGKVSESLEHMWRALQHAQEEVARKTRVGERLAVVVEGATQVLSAGVSRAASVPNALLHEAKTAARALLDDGESSAPSRLLEACLRAADTGSDLERKAAALAAAEETEERLQRELHRVRDELAEALREIQRLRNALAGADAAAAERQREITDMIAAQEEIVSRLQDALHDAPASVFEHHRAAAAATPDAPLADLTAALCAWKAELLADMREAIAVNATSEAVAAFLRDVLRDVIPRLVQLREGWGGEEDPMLSTRVSVALDAEEPPRPLIRGNPSHYVEYILELEGIEEEAKRAVQDHMTSSVIIGGACGGAHAPPSTWDVIADLHESLVSLSSASGRLADTIVEQREANELLTRASGELRESLEAAQTSLRGWADSAVVVRDHTQPPSPTMSLHPGECSLVAGLQEEVVAVVEALRRMKDIADEEGFALAGDADVLLLDAGGPRDLGGGYRTIRDLPSLVKAVAAMRRQLVELRGAAEDGIAVLGGRPGSATVRGAPGKGQPGAGSGNTIGPAMGDARTVKERLTEICRDTGASLQDVKAMLGITETPGRLLPLQAVLPEVQARIQELEQARKDTEVLLRGLDNALNDEMACSMTSSALSGRSNKNLKPKKKPLPALEGTPTALMAMTHRVMAADYTSEPVRAGTADMSPAARINALRARALHKIDEVHDLRLACRAAISILEGSYVEGEKPPAYGDVLVPLLLSQLEDVKKSLPQCEDALGSGARNSARVVRKTGVGAKLATLSALVQSLRMERDSLQDQLAGKARQSMILLADLEQQAEEQRRLAQVAREAASQARQESALLRAQQAALEKELVAARTTCDTLESESSRLGAAADELARLLAAETAENDTLTERAARRQHENNVLTAALAGALVELEPQARVKDAKGFDHLKGEDDAHDSTSSVAPLTVPEMEPLLRQHLASDNGEPLGRFVHERVICTRDRWRAALADNRTALAALRDEVQALRHRLDACWEGELRPLCAQLLTEVEETAEVLRVENDMLRPRAREREALAKENHTLRARVESLEADAAAAHADADARAEEVSRLRLALREAEVDQVIRAIPDGARKAGGGGGHGLVANPWPRRQEQQYPPMDAAELERRMIRGATALTMEAIDAMAGEHMAHTLGDVAARTVQLLHAVEGCVSAVREALYAYEQTHNPHALASFISDGAAELVKLTDDADQLWSAMPVLFKVPYAERR